MCLSVNDWCLSVVCQLTTDDESHEPTAVVCVCLCVVCRTVDLFIQNMMRSFTDISITQERPFGSPLVLQVVHTLCHCMCVCVQTRNKNETDGSIVLHSVTYTSITLEC